MKQTVIWTILFSLLLFVCSFVYHIPFFIDYGWGSWIWCLVVAAWVIFLSLLQAGYAIGHEMHNFEKGEIKILREYLDYWYEKYRDEVSKKEERK